MRPIALARSTLFLALLALPALAETPTVQIDDGYEGIGYKMSSGGEVQVWAAPREVGGKLGICGFVLMEKATATTRVIEKEGTSNVIFTLAGKPLRVVTDRFKRYKSMDELKASPLAGCSVIEAPWDKSYAGALTLDLGNFTVRH